MKRRQLLGLGGLLAAMPLSVFANTKKLTPSQTEGPFYPVKAIPLKPNLVLKEQGLKGNPMLLTGHVSDQSGNTVPDIKVEIWQSDGTGLYDHPKEENTNQFDTHFQGAGAAITDKKGAYQFYTLFPVAYSNRPPHIHVKLWRGQKEILTTQLYLQGQTGNEWFGGDRSLLQIDPKPNADGKLSADFTFVV